MGPLLTSHVHCEWKVLAQSGLTEPADTSSQADEPGSTRGHSERAVHPPQHSFSEVIVTRWGEIPGATDPAYSQTEAGSEHFLVRSDVL